MQVIKVIPLTDKWSLKPTAATAKSTARTTVEPVNDFSIPAEGKSKYCFLYTNLYITTVHMLLQRQLNVKDWHYRYNDTEYRWIGKMDWEFSRLLPSLQHCQQQGTVVLLDMRVDTVATITIDSDRQSSAIEPVGTVNNMFVRYRFDISKWYNTADEGRSPPTLTIRVHSPSGTARLLHDSYPYDIPDDYVPELQGEPHRNFIRKQQCSFGWDCKHVSLRKTY
jgi:beta-mannosidase